MSPGSEIPPGVASDSAVIFAECIGSDAVGGCSVVGGRDRDREATVQRRRFKGFVLVVAGKRMRCLLPSFKV
jgi:hypothetical protein